MLSWNLHLRDRRPDLLEGVLGWCLVGAPAKKLRPMTEAIRRHMVEAHLDDELGTKWFPFGALSGDQRLGPPGAFPVKPGDWRKASRRRVSLARSAFLMVEVKPT